MWTGLNDDNDNKIDLLFLHRGLRQIIAVDVKLNRFKQNIKDRWNLYLKWLDEYERKDAEKPPVGLILCPQKQREQIKLLDPEEGQIRLAEYLTQLPPKHLLPKNCTVP
jgi:hypothetical protein